VSFYLHQIAIINKTQLSITPHPAGSFDLMDELKLLPQRSILVSHLTHSEENILELKNTELFCKDLGLTFIKYPIIDGHEPESTSYINLVDKLYECTQSSPAIIVHCWAGIGRSGMTAICLLMKHGVKFDQAIQLVSDQRSYSVPQTHAQFDFLKNLSNNSKFK
jgi:protein-tyrosine phosphatase